MIRKFSNDHLLPFSALFPLFLFLMVSCSEKINLKLDDSEIRLVVEGEITNEPGRHLVKITRSAGYFSNRPPEAVSGALVSITDGELVYDLVEESPGRYLTSPEVAGVPGKTYTLNLLIDGVEHQASSTMKEVMDIDSIQARPGSRTEGVYEILLFAQEPATPGDFYMWRTYRNDTLLTDSISKVIFLADDLINGRYLNGLIVQTAEASPGDEITLEMLAVPEDYYQFVLTLMIESRWRGGPFDGPPANVIGNVSGNSLGFFVAYSKTRKQLMVPSQKAIDFSLQIPSSPLQESE
jgi:hypothetical protein